MATPHISASKGEIAKIVLMSGDPLRAKLMAEKYLTDPKLVSNVRLIPVYTGTYNGLEVSIMAHGMGVSSIGIYAFELYKFYDVELIIRVGTAGSYQSNVHVRDMIVAETALSDSNFGEFFGIKEQSLEATPSVIKSLKEKFGNHPKVHFGSVMSAISFYNTINHDWKSLAAKGVICVEMEAYALYAIAKSLNKHAATVLVISDSLVTDESLTADERVNSFAELFKVTLDSVKDL